MKIFNIVISVITLALSLDIAAKEIKVKTPYQIVADSPDADWRKLDLDNTL